MQIWLSALLAATPSPTPSVDPANTFYSPGTIGFIATFMVAAGAIVIIFDMVRRVRRVRYRGEVAAKLEAEALESKTQDVKTQVAKTQSAAKPSAPAATKKVATKPMVPGL